MRKLIPLFFALGAAITAAFAADNIDHPEQTRLLRFPAISNSQIVFSYAGQLYTVGLDGGTARRLTDGPGYAVFPRFSADGKQLAFTAQYDGNTEVYVMPAGGGIPKRLTVSATLDRDDLSDRMGPNNIVMGWRNTSNEVVFRSRWKSFNPFVGELDTVGLDGDLPKQLPVPRGGFASYSPDDTKIAYNQVFREFRTWKHYAGGMADDIWIFDLKSGAIENITNNPAQDIFPMWAPNGKIYFLSERAGRANLFAYDLKTKQTDQLTTFKDFDCKFPSLGAGGIVFEQAGQIWKFDLATGKAAVVPIVVQEDFASARAGLVNVSKFINGVSPSPDGQRVTVVARGDVFSIPVKEGPTRNLTASTGVHDRAASWSPDGKWIAYLSDATGEFELYVQAQDGRSPAVQVTTGADTYYFTPDWSPDSKKLLWGDRKQRLRYVDVESKTVTTVAQNPDSPITQYNWSPDSQWITWTQEEHESMGKIMLYGLADKKTIPVTDGWYSVNGPAFSEDGKWISFISSRDFNPIYSDTEWNHAYKDMERIYLVSLAKDTVSPFAPKSDEVEIKKDDKADDEKKDGKGAKRETKAVVVKVDDDGLVDRTIGLPIPASNYASVHVIGDKVYYRRIPSGAVSGGGGGEGFGGGTASKPVLAVYNLKDKKETELGNVDSYAITGNGKKMLVRAGREYSMIELPSGPAKIELKEKINLSGLEVSLDHHAEWNQIFFESWRQMRDYFYAPNMNGTDWAGQRDKYAKLLPYVSTRNDLTYILGEMIGELHSGHTYVGGGDRPEAPRIKLGLLGAQLSRDEKSRAYRIDKILPGENWQTSTRSPLTEIGVNVKAGDYILAVNGKPVRDMANIYSSLIGKAGKQVVLRVNARASDEGAHDITIVPIADESPLYYDAWVQANIDYVSKKTDGKVGYIHIPDMGPEGLNEFARRYYPQLSKQALIVDVRGNGGGNVSPMIIDRLRREMSLVSMRRNGTSRPNPTDVMVGPKVTLLNEYSASDGDLFPYRFREQGLGKLIGKRSWGGVIGINNTLPFTDGGDLRKPESAPYDKNGKGWVIEGHGVDPDIVVENDPAREFRGEDQQLDKGIEVIVEELKTKGKELPPIPAFPDKSLKQ